MLDLVEHDLLLVEELLDVVEAAALSAELKQLGRKLNNFIEGAIELVITLFQLKGASPS